MKLLTKEVLSKLPRLYSQEKVEDPDIIVKFFAPVGSWTWYATEGDVVRDGEYLPASEYREGDEVIFFGLVDGLERELGYFSLSELEEVRLPLGLRIERDRHFGTKQLSEVS